jgi:polar amino acid transport system permease protein
MPHSSEITHAQDADVLKPRTLFTLKNGMLFGVTLVLVSLLMSVRHLAHGTSDGKPIIEVLLAWAPFLLQGFLFNLVISAAAMLIGTIFGIALGLMQISEKWMVRAPARLLTQFFRNSPWLVLLFLCIFLLPFQLHVGNTVIPFPDWVKAILGFSLPVMSNVSEIVRGAVQAVSWGQSEAAKSLGLSRTKTMLLVILPQCVKPSLPPWMNLYAIVTMSSVNASVVGVNEMITRVSQVLAAEGARQDLLLPLYAFVLVCFFLYCYPISRLTVWLERRLNRSR